MKVLFYWNTVHVTGSLKFYYFKCFIINYFLGKVWNEGGIPILGLHGWMDNAGTFDTLAPLLPSTHSLIAIDFPGHGLSSRKPPGFGSVFTELLSVIHRVVEHFSWEKVILISLM